MDNEDNKSNESVDIEIVKTEDKEKSFPLFDNDHFEINKSDEEYDLENDSEMDNQDEEDEVIPNDEAELSSNISYDDMNSNEEEEEEEEEEEGEIEEEGEGENKLRDMGKKMKNIVGRKKKYLNKKENIYYDGLGIYKNDQMMNNDDIEDRIKYLLLLLSDPEKLNNPNLIKIEKREIIKEILYYYSYYYEYTKEMIKYLYYLFDIKELYLFLEINNMPKEIHLRTNTLKITRTNLLKILKNKNIAIQDGSNWNNVDITLTDTSSNVGSLNEYLYGYYIIQSSSSLIPVLELNIKENELVLDMCAAPGGKCTFICTIQKNKGIVYANDINKLRCKAIEAHAARMGINNLIITSFDSLKINKYFKFKFDKILLDAPCSGTGVVNKNKNARRKTIKEIRDLSQKQRKLLNNAIDMVKNGGIVIYSTCSITVEENEQVINYILKKRDVNLLPIDINIGDPGIIHYRKKQFSSKISLCKRIYLHKHNHDNFFVAKLVKRSNAKLGQKGDEKQNHETNIKSAKVKKKNNKNANEQNKDDNNEEKRTLHNNKMGEKNKHLKKKINKAFENMGRGERDTSNDQKKVLKKGFRQNNEKKKKFLNKNKFNGNNKRGGKNSKKGLKSH
ncbi:RNA methyltransferase, putative [Plasmodium berghei]|uniref:rRNA (Cytosine-C(5))-methyltransferase, putative n=2 Tax=Plasmodium berghei TaxID=5821 RepID=A0A509AJS5_PLABA|nr:rRNA (cytosine-C(5))-methyltransferase, putative [Plasmodium berghei ANKA]CXI42425.1 RNA methyltransferase, putative [Plasmodium berghei]SCM22118.1 RNA methyltransferase, putative [Plasmodium berghei]SCN25287.1 RNA methyltransferase, putative [Plasmodium berghei]SCO60264.1 RNA methyltransferase, putative [Plasmodium berghei]SCO61932.1 RNA methyltransferase, putative [Plasmodium berghei]|eukprot:XP_034421539.1 rRNA (cytosine-C(5))-methyltransferase, putative [Plasmodium berghei ANKA]